VPKNQARRTAASLDLPDTVLLTVEFDIIDPHVVVVEFRMGGITNSVQ
jgi:hypothetical protein